LKEKERLKGKENGKQEKGKRPHRGRQGKKEMRRLERTAALKKHYGQCGSAAVSMTMMARNLFCHALAASIGGGGNSLIAR